MRTSNEDGFVSRADALYRELGLGIPEPAPAPLHPTIAPERVRFAAADGRELVGDLFEPRVPPKGAVVVASAMGVRRRLYAGFASYLAEAGLLTLTFDYRGIGDSKSEPMRREKGTLTEWGEQDVAGAHEYLRAVGRGLPLAHVGHSIGGQLLALLRDARVDAALFVASQNGHFRNWRGWRRAAMATLWYAAVPTLLRTHGYLPMHSFGQGEDIPRGVATQWAEWARDRRYLGVYLDARDGAVSSELACPMRAYAFPDDPYAPVKSVKGLFAFFPRAEGELRVVRPSDLGVRAIGHFGPFRSRIGARLWPEQRAFILDSLARPR
jgi:predicted alpha/beta hydrolase